MKNQHIYNEDFEMDGIQCEKSRSGNIFGKLLKHKSKTELSEMVWLCVSLTQEFNS